MKSNHNNDQFTKAVDQVVFNNSKIQDEIKSQLSVTIEGNLLSCFQ